METTRTAVDRPKEVRIGLVLYGGVSLSIYINGTCQEFFDLVRGRGIWGIVKDLAEVDVTVDVISGASAGGINGLYLAYALCNERELEPLARLWREKAGLQELLHEAGRTDVRSVLDSEYMQRELVAAFRAMDRSACRTGRELCSDGPPRELDCFLAVTDFDGHTETIGDFRQRPLQVRNHAAQLHLKHRRGRFEPFSPEGGKETPSKDLLARFARATSAFPVAFEPVILQGDDAGKYFAHRGPYLARDQSAVFVDGGVLDNKPFTPILPTIYERHADRPVTRVLYFVEPDPDGEEEASAPAAAEEPARAEPNFFEVAFAALTTLPSYESIADDLKALDAHNRRLDVLQTVFGRTYGIIDRGDPGKLRSSAVCSAPSRESRRVYLRARLYRLLETAAEELPAAALKAVESELTTTSSTGKKGAQAEDDDRPEAGDRSRSLLATLFPELGRRLGFESLAAKEGASIDRRSIDREERALDGLDVDFCKRAYYYWTYALHDALGRMVDELAQRRNWEAEGSDIPRPPEREEPRRPARSAAEPREAGWWSDVSTPGLLSRVPEVRRTLDALAARIDMLLIVEASICAELQKVQVSEGTKRDSDVVDTVGRTWTRCLTPTDDVVALVEGVGALSLESEGPSGEARSGAVRDVLPSKFAGLYKSRFEPDDDREEGSRWSQAGELAREDESILASFHRALEALMKPYWRTADGGEEGGDGPLYLEEFRRIDCLRYPAFLLSQLGEMDRIEYFRISPRDSTGIDGGFPALGRWDDEPMSKVAGRQLGHFGGFLKRSWRSNDIMWGRVDAATVVFDSLVGTKDPGKLKLGRGRAKELVEDPEWCGRVSATLGPGSEKLLELIRRFALEGEERELREGLLAFHQQEICRRGVCEVLSDAIHEETARRHPAFDLGTAARRKTLEPDEEGRDGQEAYEERYREAILQVLHEFRGDTREPLLQKISSLVSLEPETLDEFFRDHYDVGGERVGQLDRIGLATTGLHSARVLANMTRAVLPRRGIWQKIETFFLSRATFGLTTLHLGFRSIRDGLFPIVWFATLVAAVALLAGRIFVGDLFPWAVVQVALLAFLLALPGAWFGRWRRLRWLGLLVALLVSIVAGYPHPPGFSPPSWLRTAMERVTSAAGSWLRTAAGRWSLAAAIVVVLAVGAGWLLRRRWRRRWTGWIGFLRTYPFGARPRPSLWSRFRDWIRRRRGADPSLARKEGDLQVLGRELRRLERQIDGLTRLRNRLSGKQDDLRREVDDRRPATGSPAPGKTRRWS